MFAWGVSHGEETTTTTTSATTRGQKGPTSSTPEDQESTSSTPEDQESTSSTQAKEETRPRKAKKGPRRGAKKAPPKKKGSPANKGSSQRKKGRRIKIKLGLRQSRLTKEEDTYHDEVGWTISQEVLEPLEDIEDNQEPEAVNHQCSMCGSIMQIPQPKRERYKVLCAYPECGHEDSIGF